MPTHTVKSFDEELKRLMNLISQMGGLVETQVQDCILSLAKRDSTIAERVIQGDLKIDGLEYDVNDLTVRMLALRQPLAEDLRRVVGALKISADLERIGDYAANISERAVALNQLPPARPAGRRVWRGWRPSARRSRRRCSAARRRSSAAGSR